MSSRTLLERWAPPLGLVVAVLALYAQLARHEFVAYDTPLYLSNNPRVLAGLEPANVGYVFTHFLAANWHPLTWISHMLDVELFGLEPAGHLLENAAWHAANALLVLALFGRLGLARGVAFAGALLFALHPLRVESVAWAVERKDLLCAFFGLASLLAWLAYARSSSAWMLGGALALYACSLMSKPMLVTLPCLLLLFEYWPLGELRPRAPRLRAVAVFGLLALAGSVIAVAAQSSLGAVQGLAHLSLALRIENALASYAWYLGKSVWPAGLAFHYPIERGGADLSGALLGAALIGALSLGAWRLRARVPGVLVGWLWFLGTLVPVIGLVQVGAQAHADRFTYFPGLGLVLALLLLVQHELLPRLGARSLAVAGTLAVLALGRATWLQIGTWRDTEALARHALEVTRDNNVALDVLGVHYSERGQPERALPLLREAIRIAPGDPDVITNLGATLVRLGEYEESEALLLRATALVPWRAQPWSHLGASYYAQQRFAEALGALDRALACDPDHTAALTNRGLALEALGRLDEARPVLERAVELRPNSYNARLALGRLHLRQGRPTSARAQFEALLAHDPRHFDALRGLERVELAAGDLAAAWALAERALAVHPDSAPALADEAWILAFAREGALAQPRRALELAERALASGGEQPALLDAFALAAAANGDFARAVAAAERALGHVRGVDPLWAARLELRLAAYRAGRVDRETPR